MKLVCSLFFPLFLVACLWGQAEPKAAPAPQAPPSTQPASPGRPMPVDMAAWRLQRTLRLMMHLKDMRSKLDEMKTNAAKVKDPAVKQQLQLDNQLWEMMCAHVEEMTSLMQPPQRQASHSGPITDIFRGQQTLQQGGAPTAAPEAAKPTPPPDPR